MRKGVWPAFSALSAFISVGKVPTWGSTGQTERNSQLINGQPLTRQQRPRCSRQLALSPLASILLYLGASGRRWEETGLNNVSRSAITQQEGIKLYINRSVRLKGKGLNQSPLYFLNHKCHIYQALTLCQTQC